MPGSGYSLFNADYIKSKSQGDFLIVLNIILFD
jgi:hypothetical protein